MSNELPNFVTIRYYIKLFQTGGQQMNNTDNSKDKSNIFKKFTSKLTNKSIPSIDHLIADEIGKQPSGFSRNETPYFSAGITSILFLSKEEFPELLLPEKLCVHCFTNPIFLAVSVLRQEEFLMHMTSVHLIKEWYTEPVCRDLKFLGIPAEQTPQNYPRQT